jgi:hypothetical protein
MEIREVSEEIFKDRSAEDLDVMIAFADMVHDNPDAVMNVLLTISEM